jgi:hypothetical protein
MGATKRKLRRLILLFTVLGRVARTLNPKTNLGCPITPGFAWGGLEAGDRREFPFF